MQSLSYSTLEQIVRASVHGILLVEVHRHRAEIRYANPAYEKLSGYMRRELCGNAWSAHFDGDCPLSDPHELSRLIMRGLPAAQPVSCLRKDGSVWQSDMHVSRVGGAAGDAVLILAQHVVENAVMPVESDTGEWAVATSDATAGRRVASAVPGMLSADQFVALLSRDIALARRNAGSVTLILFQVQEFDIYLDTFGELAAEGCARMVGRQILGTFGASTDLCARLDERTFAVGLSGDGRPEAAELAACVSEKTVRLGLHNPRGRLSRQIRVDCACIDADTDSDNAAGLIRKCRSAFDGDLAKKKRRRAALPAA